MHEQNEIFIGKSLRNLIRWELKLSKRSYIIIALNSIWYNEEIKLLWIRIKWYRGKF